MRLRPRAATTAGFTLALSGFLAACGGVPPETRATLIVDARLVDGLGTPARAGSLRIQDGVIEAVGDLEIRADDTVVDADGMILAPGFIDTHSHHDIGLFEKPEALAAVSQGITTIVVGQDGGSSFPLGDFFERIASSPPAVNVASYVGHNTLRSQVMGSDFRRSASDHELARMNELLEREMEAGALGLATGLEYDPGIYSDPSEVLSLAKATAALNGRYISHMRSEDRDFWTALEELLEIGRQTGMPVQISHMKLAMKSLWGRAPELLERLDQARAAGVDVSADVYPYTFWQSTMRVLFPERDFANRDSAAFALEELAPPDGMWFARYDPEPSYVGKTLEQIARLRGTDPVSAYLDLLAEAKAAAGGSESWGESIIATSMDEDDVARLIAWPHSNVCSDGGLDGRHPRGFGSFPRVLAREVRERGNLSWEKAIRKMTFLAAEHVGLQGRGALYPGSAADLVLIDPDTVSDRATADDPQAVSVGIEKVWVNGELVWSDAAVTGSRPGRGLRREPPAE